MVMMRGIEKELVPLGVTTRKHSLQGEDVFGGYFVWITLPGAMDADVVAKACLDEQNLIVSPGSAFKVPGDTELGQKELLGLCIRLCFSYMDHNLLTEGVQRLSEVIKDKLAQK